MQNHSPRRKSYRHTDLQTKSSSSQVLVCGKDLETQPVASEPVLQARQLNEMPAGQIRCNFVGLAEQEALTQCCCI